MCTTRVPIGTARNALEPDVQTGLPRLKSYFVPK